MILSRLHNSSLIIYRVFAVTDLCYPKSSSLLSVEQAQQTLQQAISSIEESEILELSQALGRVAATGVHSAIDIPPQPNSAMDGYAFASADLLEQQPFSLTLAGYSWAGKPFTGEVLPGQCIRIFTGALVPEFADSVVAQEQVQIAGEQIHFPATTQPYRHIRAAGSDVKRQQLLVSPGKTLTASDLALLAAAGVSQVRVKRRVKIAFFSTGDELSALGAPLAPGQIYDSNRYLLAGLLASPRHEVTDIGIIKDDKQQLETTLLQAAQQHDLIISTGGASVGEADFVQEILAQCGQVNFWKIAIKPGKPLAFGRIGASWFFGLPGNPVAVKVTFDKFVQPALQKLAGSSVKRVLQLPARCETSLRKAPGRSEYQRGILTQHANGQFTVKAAGGQDSHQLSVTSLANCYIVLAAECSGVAVDETVIVEPFDTWI